MASPAHGIPRSWLAALLRELGRRPYWSSRRRSLRDVVVRVLLRRRTSTPLPPKSQLPLAEYVYCYGPLDPDDPDGTTDWHWAPRKDYFDRSADAALEYYAPMSSSASVNELPRSRRSSVSECRPGSRASAALGDMSGAPARELDERLKQYEVDEMLCSSAADMLLSGTRALADAAPGFRSPPARLAAAQDGVFAFAVNVPYPSEYHSPSRPVKSGCMAPLKSILKIPKPPTPALRLVSPPSPAVHPHFIPSHPRTHPAHMPFSPPPLISPVPSSPEPFILPPFSLQSAHPGPASLVGPSPPSSPAVEHPIIPPFPFPAPAPFPSLPHTIYTRAPFITLPASPHFAPPDARLFDLSSPPSPAVACSVIPPFPLDTAAPCPYLSPPHLPHSTRVPHPPHAHPGPAEFAPSPPLPPFEVHPHASRPRGYPLNAPRNYPPGYAGGVSSLLAAPSELLVNLYLPHALLRRRLNLTQRIPVALTDPALAESAFYPTAREVLLVLPQLPWAVSLNGREGSGYLSVGDVLGGLREHLAARVRPAEREMLPAAGRVGARGDALGDRAWLLGMWEDADAVHRVVGAGQDDFVRGRRCFVVLFGGEEETMC